MFPTLEILIFIIIIASISGFVGCVVFTITGIVWLSVLSGIGTAFAVPCIVHAIISRCEK